MQFTMLTAIEPREYSDVKGAASLQYHASATPRAGRGRRGNGLALLNWMRTPHFFRFYKTTRFAEQCSNFASLCSS